MQICNNIDINGKGHLTFAGKDTLELAKKYGTPLYLMDEGKIREKMRTYIRVLWNVILARVVFRCLQVRRQALSSFTALQRKRI